jgi:hypothetical protein
MDMLDIRDSLGHNFMRLAHYPNDPFIYDLADSLGIIVVEEVPNIKNIDFDETVQEQNVREMIRRDRNHPSIFFWSMGNETSDAADSKWAWEEDTSRIIHVRKGEGAGDFKQHDHTNLDMENLLRVTIRGWFGNDDAPEGINSEPANGQFASNESWQHFNAMREGGSVRGILGQNCSAWLYQDHGADREYKDCILKHINPKGWVDMYRQPKYIYHLTKACYTDHPVIFIHPHFWREKYTGQVRDIIVDSNCDSVFLSVNGRFISKQHLLDKAFKTFVFENIKIENGFVEAVGYKNGRKYTSKVVMPGKPARIILSTSQRELIADRSGIAIIKADITDINGNPVFDATNTLHWQVTGPASLVGPEIYKSNIHNNESPEGCGYTVVPVCNLVRSHDVSGKIIIKVSSEGLDPAEIEISSIAPSKEPGTTWLFERMPKSEGRTKVQRVKIDKPVMSIKTELKPIKENVKIDASKEEEIHRAISLLIRNNSDSLFIN